MKVGASSQQQLWQGTYRCWDRSFLSAAAELFLGPRGVKQIKNRGLIHLTCRLL